MKLVSSTVIVGILSLLGTAAPGVEAANRHAGTRRQLDLQDAQSAGTLQKRVPLAARELPPIQVGPKLRMIRRGSLSNVKRAPLANAEPVPNAGFGAVPMMNPGTAPIVGMVAKRGDLMHAHNGEQGTAVEVSYASTNNKVANTSNGGSSSSSSGSSSGSNTSSSSSSDDDDEECDADDDEDDDAEDCDETDGDDEEEDCEEEEDDNSTSTSAASSSGVSTASTSSSNSSDSTTASTDNVKVALKVPGSGSSSSASGNNGGSATSSSSASASKSTGSSSSSSGSSNGQTFTGISTWYTQNGNAGACGKVNPDSAHVIALYTSAYANGANCGRTVEIQNLDDGTSTTAVVADMCPSCGGPGDIDLSVGTFSAIDPQYQTHGVRNIKWWYTD